MQYQSHSLLLITGGTVSLSVQNTLEKKSHKRNKEINKLEEYSL